MVQTDPKHMAQTGQVYFLLLRVGVLGWKTGSLHTFTVPGPSILYSKTFSQVI